jgi:hypothetical protein
LGGVAANQVALYYAYNCVYDLIHPNNEIEEYFSPDHEGYQHIGDDGDPRYKYFRMQDEGGGWYNVLDTFGINIDKDVTEAGRIMLKLGTMTDTTSKFDKTDQIKEYAAKKASDYLGFTFTHDKNNSWWTKDSNDMSQVSISLTNIVQAFLTSYVQYMQGIEDSDYTWQFGSKTDPSVNLYNGNKDKNFMFTIATDTEVEDGDSQLYANFYDTLFNRICMNGWIENDNIDDKEYMQELLKNGMAFVSSMSDDGFYYQGNYATDRTILEVTDDEAVARAQAKYNREKASIEYKEDRIDMKMKNLDTEISSLSTEYDTTKQLITKTVEKSFKRYEA